VRLQRLLLVAALLVLWLGGNRWVAYGLARSLEWRYLPLDPVPHAPVIVVLGGGTEPADYPRSLVEVTGAGDRVLYTVWLYQQGAADWILISGGSIDWGVDIDTPAHQMAALLEMLGVPVEAMWLDPDSRNTYENAQNSAAILDERGVDRIILVTSAAHMPRSVRLFEAQGLDVIPAPTDYVVTEAGWEALREGNLQAQIMALLPSASNLALTTKVLKEYLGMFVYSLRGWE
jgi:uncharacterized SAM-binding protein YcdF (DUF218 family)